MPNFDVILYTVMLLASTATAQPCQETKLSPSVPVLPEIVESFDVQNSTMEEALRALRQHDFANILIGFEKIAHREGERTESLSLSTKSATVGEILDKLCQQSKQYRYEIIEGGIIYVHPAHAKRPARTSQYQNQRLRGPRQNGASRNDCANRRVCPRVEQLSR